MKKNLYLMYAISCLQGMVFYGPIATLYRQAADVGIFEITLIESISMALTVALELPFGILADRIGYRRTMMICCLLYFVSKIVFWRAAGFGGFLAERILLAVVCAGLSGVDASMVYLSCENKKETQKAFGFYDSFGMAGLLAAGVIYTVFIGENYRLSGLMTVVSYGVAAVLALFLKEVRPPERKKAPARAFLRLLGETVKNRKLLLLILSSALFLQTHQTVTVFLNQLQYARAGMSGSAIAFAFTVMVIAGLSGCFSARLTRLMGDKRTGLLLIFSGLLACGLLCITKNAVLSVLMVVSLRLCASLFTPLKSRLENDAIFSVDRATALSLNAVMMEGVAVVTNLLFGAAAEKSVEDAMALGALLSALSLVLFFAAVRRSKDDSKEAPVAVLK